MFVVDTQVHVWADDRPDRPWIPGGAARIVLNGHRQKTMGYEELRGLMKEAGVSRVLIVPPSWEGDRVDLGFEASEKYPDEFGLMARVDLGNRKQSEKELDEWIKHPGFKGTRLTFHRYEDRKFMFDGSADWYWPYAEKNNIPTMVHCPVFKQELGDVAAKYPKLKLIVDHFGIVGHTTDDNVKFWITETCNLAKYPNVFVKTSALPGYSSQPYPYSNMNKYMKQIVDAFGARRCFWGTDLTRMMERNKLTYKQTVEHFTVHMRDILSEQDLEWIMGKGICEVLNWPINETAAKRAAG